MICCGASWVKDSGFGFIEGFGVEGRSAAWKGLVFFLGYKIHVFLTLEGWIFLTHLIF